MRSYQYYIILVSFLFLSTSCAKVNHVADVNSRNYRIEKASFPVDTKVASMIEPYKAKLDETMNDVIGYNEVELTKGKPNSGLTNWFSDVLLEESQKLVTEKVDFAIQNYGGIRIPVLAQGNVTVGKIYELMPFDNLMYIQELPGSVVLQLFDKIAESGGWPISHSVSMDIAYGKAKNIFINGVALDTAKTYIAAIPDYIANGGDNMIFLKGVKTTNTNALIRDLLINNIRFHTSQGRNIKSNPAPRIKD